MSPGQLSLLGLFLPASLCALAGTGLVAGKVAVQSTNPLPRYYTAHKTRCHNWGVQDHAKGHLCTLAAASGLLLPGPNTESKQLLLM